MSIRSFSKKFSQSLLGGWTMPIWLDAQCVFILSTGRTGTQTLTHLLDSSSEINAYHEPRPQLLEERKHARVEVYAKKQKYTRIFVQARGYPLFKAKRKGKIYVETSARLTFFAPVIAKLMPNARFIYMHRNPADVIRSGMRRRWYIDHPADYARVEPVAGETYFDEWEAWDEFTKICWYWDVYNRFALHFREQIDPSRILTIKSKDMFNGSAVPTLFDFIGVEMPDSSRIEEVINTKYNAQLGSDFPFLEDWSSEMCQTLERIAGDTMRRLGYLSIPSMKDQRREQGAR